jgi:hypothetical protein
MTSMPTRSKTHLSRVSRMRSSFINYPNFQHLVDKANIIENKLKEMEKDGKCKMGFLDPHSRGNTKPYFSQPS